MKRSNRSLLSLVILGLISLGSPKAWADGSSEPPIQIVPRLELGFARVVSHRYQSGANGTLFDFVKQGGQDTLFPYQRFSVEAIFGGRHHATLLYQPLTLNTRTVANRNGTNGDRPIVIDDASFVPGTPLDITYGFDFWRASYLYDFIKEPATLLGVGASLQLRNAAISFTSGDGAIRTVSQNIGPVPILKVRAAHWFHPLFGLDLEADGFYASSAIFNGSGRPFEGWIWDASLTAKTRFLPQAVAFVVVRTIGGGAKGNNAYSYVSSTTTVNPATFNALSTIEISLGAAIE